MRFYINYDSKGQALPKKEKLDYLLADGGFPVHDSFNFDKTPIDLSLIAIEDNGSFDVAFMLTREEWVELTSGNRPYKLILYPRDKAMSLSGMKDYLEC